MTEQLATSRLAFSRQAFPRQAFPRQAFPRRAFPRRAWSLGPGGVAGVLLLSGCVAPANDEIGLGPDAPLHALGETDETPDPASGAPLLGGDRSNWPTVTVHVPMTHVSSYPNYWAHRPLGDDAELGTTYPTAMSALDGPPGDDGIGEALLEVGRGLIDIPWSPIAAAFDGRWPGQLEERPPVAYQRTPGYGVAPTTPEADADTE